MESHDLLRIMDEFQTITELINSLAKKEAPKPTYRSEDIQELAMALAKAQGQMKIANENKGNPFFKSRYADLMSVVMAARPALSANGLSVVQNIIDHEDGTKMVHTILLHNSGQYIESRMRVVPMKNDIQSISSTVTYIKRMAYASLVGVVVGDEDDDGEIAMVPAREMEIKGPSLSVKYDPRQQSTETISKDQLDELHYELEQYPDIADEITLKLNLQSLADLPKSKYMPTIERIRVIKAARNGTK